MKKNKEEKPWFHKIIEKFCKGYHLAKNPPKGTKKPKRKNDKQTNLPLEEK